MGLFDSISGLTNPDLKSRVIQYLLGEGLSPEKIAQLKTIPVGQVHSFRELFKDNPEEYAKIAPYEHQDFARSVVGDNPLMSVPVGVAAPLYYLAKQPGLMQIGKSLGLVGEGATPASLRQVQQSYQGIGEGMIDYFRKKTSN